MTTKQRIESFVSAKIHRICTMTNEGQQKAVLAKLRRGAGRAPGDLPETMGELLLDFPDALMGKDSLSPAEWAVFTALTMYALHQQGNDPQKESMHESGVDLGTAVARLVPKEGSRDDKEAAFDRVRTRFNRLAMSESVEDVSQYLRGIVQLLRRGSIPLDYAKLASDLYAFRFEEGRSNVRLRWGRQLYSEFNRIYYNEGEKENEK